MAWTFLQQLPNDVGPHDTIGYRFSFTDGVITHTEYHLSDTVLSPAQQLAAKNALLSRLNNPPPRDTSPREIKSAIVAIQNDASLTTKAAKWDALVTYLQTIVGADP